MAMEHPEGASYQVIVLAPRGRDSALTCEMLQASATPCREVRTLDEMVPYVEQHGAGALLITQEAVGANGWDALSRLIGRQPAWSDLPVILFTVRSTSALHEALTLGGNVTLLERPVQRSTLVAAVRSALRARGRQYELRDLLHRRDELVHRLAEADRRKDEFLAALSHELRTPMSAISTAIEVLKLTLGDRSGQPAPIGIVERQMVQLRHLVDDLLDVSRVTKGKIDLRCETLDLREVAVRSLQAVEALSRSGRLTIQQQLAPEPVLVSADPVRMEQVITNLVTNAIKYTPPGGHVVVSVDAEGDAARVRVCDDGIGIDPDMLPHVFELFAQAAQPLDRTRGGLGVGLHLARSLVERHGGRIEARSEGLGRGSEFTVEMPRLIHEPVVEPERYPRPWTAVPGGGRPLRVLVVEDNVDTREMLVTMLRLWGHEVQAAPDGRTGLAALLEGHPDVALVDIGLPQLDGYALARQARREQNGHHVRLIAVSGYGQPHDRARAHDAGFDDHLVKPVQIEALQEQLQRIAASVQS
jgi:signal transduction histidine kinase